jgi:hypothetical protein
MTRRTSIPKPPSRRALDGLDRKHGRLPASRWSKSDLRAEQQDLVAAYLAKGGAITKGDAGPHDTPAPTVAGAPVEPRTRPR